MEADFDFDWNSLKWTPRDSDGRLKTLQKKGTFIHYDEKGKRHPFYKRIGVEGARNEPDKWNDIFERNGHYYTCVELKPMSREMLVDYGTERPQGRDFNYFKQKAAARTASPGPGPASKMRKISTERSQSPAGVEKQQKPSGSGRAKSPALQQRPVTPTKPMLPPFKTVPTCLPGQPRKKAEIYVMDRVLEEEEIALWRAAPGRNPNLLTPAILECMQMRHELIRGKSASPPPKLAPVSGKRGSALFKERYERAGEMLSLINNTVVKQLAEESDREPTGREDAGPDNDQMEEDPFSGLIATLDNNGGAVAAQSDSHAESEASAPQASGSGAASASAKAAKPTAKVYPLNESTQLKLKPGAIVEPEELRGYLAGVDLDVMNLDEHFVCTPYYTEPVFGEDGRCVYCKAHKRDSYAPHTSAECEFIKCGCSHCILEEYFYEEEQYLADPNPPRPLSDFPDDPLVAKGMRHFQQNNSSD